MSAIDRRLGLATSSGSLELECSPEGLFLAGAPLLRKADAGFAPRSGVEIAALLRAAYGAEDAPVDLSQGLERIAQSLNAGDLARAMIILLQLNLPSLAWEGAARVALTEDRLSKYDPNEARDSRGRWTTTDVSTTPVHDQHKARPRRTRHARRKTLQKPRVVIPEIQVNPKVSAGPKVSVKSSEDRLVSSLNSLLPVLEDHYDVLGPIQFADKVSGFGYWLGQQAHDRRPIDLDGARAEYAFLQDRLSFWLGYDGTSPREHNAVLKAALDLFTGAVASGVVGRNGGEGWPRSMDDVIVASMADEGGSPHFGMRRLVTGELPDSYTPVMPQRRGPLEGIGGRALNVDADIRWGRIISTQGASFERFLSRTLPSGSKLSTFSKTWDFFVKGSGRWGRQLSKLSP